MGMKTIPQKVIYECDMCGIETDLKKNIPHWGRLRMNQGATDFQGNIVADASYELWLCAGCKKHMNKVINGQVELMKSAKEGREDAQQA